MRGQEGSYGRKDPTVTLVKRDVGTTRGQQRIAKNDGYVPYSVTQQRMSPVRAAGAGIGIGGLAYSVPRLDVMRRAMNYGRSSPSPVLPLAERITAPLGRAASKLGQSSIHTAYWGRVIPRGARMAGVGFAGATLLYSALPIHQPHERRVRVVH